MNFYCFDQQSFERMKQENQKQLVSRSQGENSSSDFFRMDNSDFMNVLDIGKHPVLQNSFSPKLTIFEQPEKVIENGNQGEGGNPKNKRKHQNKVNARKAREKKKQQIEEIKKKNIELERENKRLRKENVCKICFRTFQSEDPVTLQIQSQKKVIGISEKHNLGKKKVDFQQYEEVTQKQKRRGKIWIGLGLIMILIGLQIHGIFGSSQNSIKVPKEDLQHWKQVKQSEKNNEISIRIKEKIPTNTMMSTDKLFQEVNIFEKLNLESQQEFALNSGEGYEKITFDKTLFDAIQAEIDKTYD